MERSATRKILVTGGCGFIGAALVDGFADAGHEVVAVDVKCRPFRDDVTFIDLDITDRSGVLAACEGIDSIVHCASVVHTRSTSREIVWRVNHGGTLNILAACEEHGIPRLVHTSSASVVYEGKDIENGDENLPYSRLSRVPYAASKIAAEKAVLAFVRRTSTRGCALRPHLVFGPGDGRVVPNILKKASAGRLSREIGNRDKLSDFTYIANLVDAFLVAEATLEADSPVCGQAYFVTNGEPKPFFGFVEELLVALGYPPIRRRTPLWLAYSAAAVAEMIDALRAGEPRPEDGLSRFAVRYLVTHHYFDIGKAFRDFGWKPRVSLAEGIKLTVDDLRVRRGG